MERILENWNQGAVRLRGLEPRLGPIIDGVGKPDPKMTREPFRALVEGILSQQLSAKAAGGILRKFRALSPPFPRHEELRKIHPARLRSAGVSRQKAGYLKSLAVHWDKLPRTRKGWEKLSDERIVESLTEVKGIGEWTAHMFLIFCLGRHDVLPVGDYGVQKGIQLLFGLQALPKAKEVPSIVGHWKGAYSVGAWYLWQGLDRKLIR